MKTQETIKTQETSRKVIINQVIDLIIMIMVLPLLLMQLGNRMNLVFWKEVAIEQGTAGILILGVIMWYRIVKTTFVNEPAVKRLQMIKQSVLVTWAISFLATLLKVLFY